MSTIVTRIETVYETQLEALDLSNDITRLRLCWDLLDKVDGRNVSQDPDVGRRVLRLMQSQLRLADRHASNKLAKEFLLPRKKIEPKRRHIVR